METIKSLNSFMLIQLIEEKQGAIKGIKYCKRQLSKPLENWEKKEYKQLIRMYQTEITALNKQIRFCKTC